jgi:biopolymer transport protein ExbB
MVLARCKALVAPLMALALLGFGGVTLAQDETAAEAPPAVETAAAEVENPYGLGAAWSQGDFVSKGAFVILGIMSAATWYILIIKLVEQGKILKQARTIGGSYWDKGASESSLAELKQDSSFRYVAERGIKAARHHDSSALHENQQVDRASWIQVTINRAADEIQSALQGGLSVLATVGSTAPFVGLFGTVWGIYHALTAIGISGQASIDKVAGPVGEALIMTALGLAVAVPAVLGYNWLVRRNKTAMEQVRSFGADLHSVLLSGSRIA